MTILTVTCCLGGLIWFWNPYAKGHLVALGAVILNLLETSLGALIGFNNSELDKQAYSLSREARDLTVRPEVLQMMDRPMSQLFPGIITGVSAILWIVLIVKLKQVYQSE